MIFSSGSLEIINIILCFLINLFCYLIYNKSKKTTIINIGIALGLFGLSHIIIFFNLTEIFYIPLLIIRFLAYLLIINTILYSNKQVSFKLITTLAIIITSFCYFSPQILNLLSVKINNGILVLVINLIFSILIATFSIVRYRKLNNLFFLFIGIAFFLFSISHSSQILVTMLSSTINIVTILAILRIISYFLILTGTYLLIKAKNISDKIIKITTNIKIQVIIIIFMITSLMLLFYYPNKQFLSSDPKPKISAIKPNPTDNQIKEITIGLYVKNFQTFDVIKNKFIMNAIIWFEFDPHQININTIKSFSFEKGKILKKSNLNSKIIGDKLWVYYKVKVEFNCDLNYQFFPIEDHKIYINVANTQMNPDTEILVSHNTNLVMADEIFTGDWKKIDGNVEYGYIEQHINKYEKKMTTKYPIVSFELSFEKAGIRKTLAIFLPLFLVFLLSLLSLVINIQNQGGILSLSVGSTSALVLNLLAIEGMSPNVRYFTIANKIYSLLLAAAFIILLLNIYIIKEIKNEANKKKLLLLRSYSFIFLVFLILLTIYSILY